MGFQGSTLYQVSRFPLPSYRRPFNGWQILISDNSYAIHSFQITIGATIPFHTEKAQKKPFPT